ncbi:universal stress protein [Haloglomus litoreum]|uniref:universal stress protein n=1 Tax=Haloglomus litoreum TaxID=3034026 RepID=UPI0023E8D13F|nr:universal stress protein [Haloglomus sp. DT116]
MDDEPFERPVLVGVGNPEAAQQLVRTAGDLAALGGGTVRLVTVAVKPHDSPFGVFADETIVDEFAGESHALLESVTAPPGVTLEREVVTARSVAKGLLAAVEETDPTALVVGWHGRRRRSDAVLGSTIDTLVERAPCDLHVERVGREANGVASVLLAVAGGPHVDAAANVARAIAARNDAPVLVLSVATDGTDTDTAAAFVDEGRAALTDRGPEVAVTTAVGAADDVADAIVAEASDHDVVVMGATRQGAIRRTLAGSVPRRVVDRTAQTVILARDGDTVGGPLHRLGGLLRR